MTSCLHKEEITCKEYMGINTTPKKWLCLRISEFSCQNSNEYDQNKTKQKRSLAMPSLCKFSKQMMLFECNSEKMTWSMHHHSSRSTIHPRTKLPTISTSSSRSCSCRLAILLGRNLVSSASPPKTLDDVDEVVEKMLSLLPTDSATLLPSLPGGQVTRISSSVHCLARS